MLHSVVLTQYWRVTDGRTDGQMDGIAIASAALEMRALRRVVKSEAGKVLIFKQLRLNSCLTAFMAFHTRC